MDPHQPQSTDSDIAAFLYKLNLPSLTDEQLPSLNTPITVSEIPKIIDSLLFSKSPGLDGFSNDYYKTFQTLLATHLVNLFTTVISNTVGSPKCINSPRDAESTLVL